MAGAVATISREIVVGRNSSVWRAMATSAAVAERFRTTISHADLSQFDFDAADRVWVFSYSRRPEENSALLDRLSQADVSEVIYVSSASTIVTHQTNCYLYPRLKRAAEIEAQRLLGALVLTLGLVYARSEELPGGVNVATSHEQLEQFLLNPSWPDNGGTRKNLFRLIECPFPSSFERALYRTYGHLITLVSRRPCILRPLDAVLRAFGYRWYGYFYLSNRLWTTTIS
jgi:hypothetical protein